MVSLFRYAVKGYNNDEWRFFYFAFSRNRALVEWTWITSGNVNQSALRIASRSDRWTFKKDKGQHVGLDPSFGFDLADQEADREVAILLKDTGESCLSDKRVKNTRKINRKSTEHKYKHSSSAPILTIPDLPPVDIDENESNKKTDETPILYGCSLCNFLCTEKHFIAAHMQIEHVSVRKIFKNCHFWLFWLF